MKRSLMLCVFLALTACGVSEPRGVQASAICDPGLYAESAAPAADGREQMQCHAMTIANECSLGVRMERAVAEASFLSNVDRGLMKCLGNAPEADIAPNEVAASCGCISAAVFAECMTCPKCDCMSH